MAAKRKPKKDVYAIVTEQILEALDAGIVPWRKTWKGSEVPTSYSSNKPYRGINAVLLYCAGLVNHYSSSYYLTFNQCSKLGGTVRKGEHGHVVTFWKWLEKEDKDGEKKRVPFLRFFKVFNFDQCDGLEAPDRITGTSTASPIEAAEAIVAGYENGPEILHEGAQPRYNQRDDRVTVPVPAAFESPEEYYAALFHELGHSTGHKSRLGRMEDHAGIEAYSKEELVAEFSAAFLCGHSGVQVNVENTAAYIDGWRKRIAEDPKLLVSAAGQAQKAADHILGVPAYKAPEND